MFGMLSPSSETKLLVQDWQSCDSMCKCFDWKRISIFFVPLYSNLKLVICNYTLGVAMWHVTVLLNLLCPLNTPSRSLKTPYSMKKWERYFTDFNSAAKINKSSTHKCNILTELPGVGAYCVDAHAIFKSLFLNMYPSLFLVYCHIAILPYCRWLTTYYHTPGILPS